MKAWHRTNPFYLQVKLPAAAIMARKGSSAVAKRGRDYFRQLAARRTKHGGGRAPRSPSNGLLLVSGVKGTVGFPSCHPEIG